MEDGLVIRREAEPAEALWHGTLRAFDSVLF